MPDTVAEKNALVELTSPLGKDVLRFHSMNASEQLGRLFEYDIFALSRRNDIRPDELLGRMLSVRLETQISDAPRFFNAHVCRLALVGKYGADHVYQIAARPWLWFLTRTTDCRIFQNQTVPQIISAIFSKYPTLASVSMDGVKASYRRWAYCVQYRETDFNFVMRLMEQEGIYFYFTHTEKHHTLVLVDSKTHHTKCPGYETLEYHSIEQATIQNREHVKEWVRANELQPIAYATTDFDFARPQLSLKTKKGVTRAHQHANFEVFDYPGEYVDRGEGEQYAQARLEEINARFDLIRGATNARGLSPGRIFTLSKHPGADQNSDYLVTGAEYRIQGAGHQALDAGPASYACTFTALRGDQQFRLQRVTPKAYVSGPQTAMVVGPKGHEIHTDKYGRVKCQFHWDRHGSANENSSCWIRVSQPWAGKNWGSVSIPRIGHEVIVDFLEGDPDQPIITGRVYNGENMPPYALPGNAHMMGFRSNSTPGGSGYCEMVIHDDAGKELISIHSQKDMATTVLNNQTNTVRDGYQTNVVKQYIKVESIDADIHLKAKTNIVLEVGASKLTMNQDGTIHLEGKNVTVSGSDHVQVLASRIDLNN